MTSNLARTYILIIEPNPVITFPFDDIMKYILQIVKMSKLDSGSLNDIEFMDLNLKSLAEKPKPKLPDYDKEIKQIFSPNTTSSLHQWVTFCKQ